MTESQSIDTSTLSPEQKVLLTAAMAELKSVKIRQSDEYFVGTLLAEVFLAPKVEVTYYKGQGCGAALGLLYANVITTDQCEALRQIFKDAAQSVEDMTSRTQ